jgi:hypothetical protein
MNCGPEEYALPQHAADEMVGSVDPTTKGRLLKVLNGVREGAIAINEFRGHE